MTLDSFNAFTVAVTPQSVLWKYRNTVKPVLSGHSKKIKNWFQNRLSLNAGQKYCRMLQCEHFAILSTFIKQPFVIKIFVLSIFERPFKTGFTVFNRVLFASKCFSMKVKVHCKCKIIPKGVTVQLPPLLVLNYTYFTAGYLS